MGQVRSSETADEHVRSKNSWDTKRAVLKAVANLRAAKKVEDNEKNLTHVKGLMKKYGVCAGAAVQEDLRGTVVIDFCTKNLAEHL